MNYWIFTGNVASDPVMRKTSSGKDLCSFSVALNIYRKDSDNEVMFVQVAAWERLANYAQNARKGTKICVCGNVEPPTVYTKKSDNSPAVNLSVRAVDLFFANPNGAGLNRTNGGQQAEQPEQQNNSGFSGFNPNNGGWFGNTPY